MEIEIPERTDVEISAPSIPVNAEDFMQELMGTGGIRSIKHISVRLTISQEAHTKVRRPTTSLQFLSFFEEPPITNSLRVV